MHFRQSQDVKKLNNKVFDNKQLLQEQNEALSLRLSQALNSVSQIDPSSPFVCDQAAQLRSESPKKTVKEIQTEIWSLNQELENAQYKFQLEFFGQRDREQLESQIQQIELAASRNVQQTDIRVSQNSEYYPNLNSGIQNYEIPSEILRKENEMYKEQNNQDSLTRPSLSISQYQLQQQQLKEDLAYNEILKSVQNNQLNLNDQILPTPTYCAQDQQQDQQFQDFNIVNKQLTSNNENQESLPQHTKLYISKTKLKSQEPLKINMDDNEQLVQPHGQYIKSKQSKEQEFNEEIIMKNHDYQNTNPTSQKNTYDDDFLSSNNEVFVQHQSKIITNDNNSHQQYHQTQDEQILKFTPDQLISNELPVPEKLIIVPEDAIHDRSLNNSQRKLNTPKQQILELNINTVEQPTWNEQIRQKHVDEIICHSENKVETQMLQVLKNSQNNEQIEESASNQIQSQQLSQHENFNITDLQPETELSDMIIQTSTPSKRIFVHPKLQTPKHENSFQNSFSSNSLTSEYQIQPTQTQRKRKPQTIDFEDISVPNSQIQPAKIFPIKIPISPTKQTNNVVLRKTLSEYIKAEVHQESLENQFNDEKNEILARVRSPRSKFAANCMHGSVCQVVKDESSLFEDMMANSMKKEVVGQNSICSNLFEEVENQNENEIQKQPISPITDNSDFTVTSTKLQRLTENLQQTAIYLAKSVKKQPKTDEITTQQTSDFSKINNLAEKIQTACSSIPRPQRSEVYASQIAKKQFSTAAIEVEDTTSEGTFNFEIQEVSMPVVVRKSLLDCDVSVIEKTNKIVGVEDYQVAENVAVQQVKNGQKMAEIGISQGKMEQKGRQNQVVQQSLVSFPRQIKHSGISDISKIMQEDFEMKLDEEDLTLKSDFSSISTNFVKSKKVAKSPEIVQVTKAHQNVFAQIGRDEEKVSLDESTEYGMQLDEVSVSVGQNVYDMYVSEGGERGELLGSEGN